MKYRRALITALLVRVRYDSLLTAYYWLEGQLDITYHKLASFLDMALDMEHAPPYNRAV